MTCQKTYGGKKTKSQRGKRSNKRKTQKGGFSLFGPADPNAPNTGFLASIFGPKKEVQNPILTADNNNQVEDDAAAKAAAAKAAAENDASTTAPVKGGKRRYNKKHKK